jgi:hypothetical protein
MRRGFVIFEGLCGLPNFQAHEFILFVGRLIEVVLDIAYQWGLAQHSYLDFAAKDEQDARCGETFCAYYVGRRLRPALTHALNSLFSTSSNSALGMPQASRTRLFSFLLVTDQELASARAPPALRHLPDALYVQEGAEDIKLALL